MKKHWTLVLAALLCVSTARAAEPFGLEQSLTPISEHFARQWQDIIQRMEEDAIFIAKCRVDANLCIPSATRFWDIVREGNGEDSKERIGRINSAVNLAVTYTSDAKQHGWPEYWATPLQTLWSQKGDCEDYAILKFAALLAAGVPISELRFVIGELIGGRTSGRHAILAVRLNDQWLVLDQGTNLLVVDKHRRDFRALYAYPSVVVPVASQ